MFNYKSAPNLKLKDQSTTHISDKSSRLESLMREDNKINEKNSYYDVNHT
jgi:hypothetical protein